MPDPEPSPFATWLRTLKSALRHRLSRWLNEGEELREVVAELVEESDAGASPAERLLLANVLSLREKTVADGLVPRAHMVAVDVDTPLPELVALMSSTRHSRIPVYQGQLDDALGMVHMKDVLDALAAGKRPHLRDLIRQVLYVPPSMAMTKLLLQMRQQRHHMALVVDEYGGIDGLVTIEDLVEEIVGEIDDEHDEVVVPRVVMRADGTLIAEAHLSIDDFEERIGEILTEEEREEIDTLGGLVFLLAGRLPAVGETFRHEPSGLEFDVLELAQNRIIRVRVRGLKQTTATLRTAASA